MMRALVTFVILQPFAHHLHQVLGGRVRRTAFQHTDHILQLIFLATLSRHLLKHAATCTSLGLPV